LVARESLLFQPDERVQIVLLCGPQRDAATHAGIQG
jgi:hypothetical protein